MLHVLEDTLRERPPAPGSHGLLMAMGPGFCSELVLLRAAAVTSLTAFTVLVVLVGLERLAELVVSKRNAAWSMERGGVETGPRTTRSMVVLHTGLLVGALVEAYVREPDVPSALAWSMLVVVVLTPGAALVVHRDPGPPLEHPGDRRAGLAPVDRRAPTAHLPPQLRRRRRRGGGAAAGARRAGSPRSSSPCSTRSC